ncbi:MAG: hypothetical protein JNG86_08575 [Verrucomicrobiaceae bacterium]|nr:hypothetical protein [Verrucomicrobiaceae bacterium]
MTIEQRLSRLASLLLPVAGWRVPVTMMRGTDKAGGRAVSLLAAGPHGISGYIAAQFFDGEPRAESVACMPLWRLRRFLEEHGAQADLTVAGIDRHSARLLFDRDWLRCPAWVGSTMQVPPETRPLIRANGHLSREWQYLRATSPECVLSRSAADFKEFYERYYKPFIEARHGALAHVRSRGNLWRRFRRGGILWLLRGGERVAGSLFAQEGRSLEVVALGLRDGNVELARCGTLFALYYHEIETARNRGCTALFLGGSRPSLHDAVLRTKRRWGAVLSVHPEVNFDMLLRWNRLEGPVADFLGHTALTHRDADALSGLWVCPPDIAASTMALEKEIQRLTSPGLRRMTVVLPAAADRPPNTEVSWIDMESVAHGGPARLHLQD